MFKNKLPYVLTTAALIGIGLAYFNATPVQDLISNEIITVEGTALKPNQTTTIDLGQIIQFETGKVSFSFFNSSTVKDGFVDYTSSSRIFSIDIADEIKKPSFDWDKFVTYSKTVQASISATTSTIVNNTLVPVVPFLGNGSISTLKDSITGWNIYLDTGVIGTQQGSINFKTQSGTYSVTINYQVVSATSTLYAKTGTQLFSKLSDSPLYLGRVQLNQVVPVDVKLINPTGNTLNTTPSFSSSQLTLTSWPTSIAGSTVRLVKITPNSSQAGVFTANIRMNLSVTTSFTLPVSWEVLP
jgi:hypothetical protein